MKKSKNKHLLQTIRKNGVSFFAVAFIAAVSIAIFLGLQGAAYAYLEEADRYFIKDKLETLEVTCANGITAEDVEAIAALDGVDLAEGGYSAMVIMDSEREKISLQTISLCAEMNVPTVIEGTLPAAADEVAVEKKFADKQGVKVGDEITLAHEGELLSETFRVTAVINHPAFCLARGFDTRGRSTAGLGSASYYVAMDKAAFDSEYYDDCFATVHIRRNAMDQLYYYSDEYKAEEKVLKEQIEALGEERAALRFESISAEAEEALADAEAEIADAETEIADGQKEIADAESELADGRKKVADAEIDVADAKAEIADAEAEIADGYAELEEKKQELADGWKEIEKQLGQLGIKAKPAQALKALAPYGSAVQPLTTAIKEYQKGSAQIQAAEKELAEAEEQIADGRIELADAEAELADAKKEIADGEAELEEAKTKLADGEAELADAKEEFAEAEADVADLELKDWIVSTRNDIGDVRGIITIADGLFGLSYAMSIIFLLVAVVVCHAAITRMIDDQRSLIGAQKALGFTPGEILKHYMTYNILCAVLGIVIGFFLSFVLVEKLVIWVFSIEFLFEKVPLTFAWKESLLAVVICFAIFLGATWVACAKLVRLPATTLLRGPVPASGKAFFFEKWKAYQKMNLYSRTMVKNVLNDKGRMATTIMGVVGCISLLVICFSLKMSIVNSSIIHFDQYFLYQNRLVINSDEGSAEEFAQILDGEGIQYMAVQDKLKNFRVDGGDWDNAHIIAVSDFEKLKDFIVLEDIKTKKTAAVPENGVLVSRKCAERNDLAAGDVIEFMDSEGNAKTFEVAGVIEHYLFYHNFVTTVDYYEAAMGEEADESVFLLKGNIDGLYEKVRNVDGFMSLKDNSDYEANADAHNLVIAICLVLSAVLALLVLLNQITMHINRKARELAVMRINGYTLKETKAYIYKDNIVLTLMGLILGCGFGVGLSYIVIVVIETGANRYVRTPNLQACLFACIVGSLFALIVNLIALRKVKTLNLTNVSSN